jgi:hypothetical protein
MRYRLRVLGIALGIGLTLVGLIWAHGYATKAALTDEERLVIEIRCPDETTREGRKCHRMLTKLYVAGALEPDTTLRAYCESERTMRWQGSQARPPRICVERYGGW